MIHRLRAWVLPTLLLLTFTSALAALRWPASLIVTGVAGVLLLVGVHDILQHTHSVLRNYPVLGHLRFLLEDVGPELRQYVVEHNLEGRPFNRDQRSLIYQRAKGVLDKKPFGTELDVYQEGHRWLTHSILARPPAADPVGTFRLSLGGSCCTKPYEASLLNASAMSFGSLSGNAVQAINLAARRGRFAQNTGEGGISRHHREHGGDLIWQIGTGYFGCRRQDGSFDPERFREGAALEAVRMVELKLSQGAKPGHGGILPGIKVTPEIARARGVRVGEDCISPPGHSTFSTPVGLLEFLAHLRELAGGKPVGFKLAVGEPMEFLGICRAIHETGLVPDFITVDGGEGGTGAAPIELSDRMGMPLLEALVIVHNALVGIGVREEVRILASGKLITSIDLATALALGADGVNTARGFMFAVGCIQSQLCHTNRCPVGVATQDPGLARALHVETKARRAENFHRTTLEAFAEVVGAVGLERPWDLGGRHLYERVTPWEIRHFSDLYPTLAPGSLIDGSGNGFLEEAWAAASARDFRGRAAPGGAARAELPVELARGAGPEAPTR